MVDYLIVLNVAVGTIDAVARLGMAARKYLEDIHVAVMELDEVDLADNAG